MKSKEEGADALFTGDTLFIGGCGRFFEGDGEMMLKNFDYVSSLDDSTLIYDGHEYTLDNLKFGACFEPKNQRPYKEYYKFCRKRIR